MSKAFFLWAWFLVGNKLHSVIWTGHTWQSFWDFIWAAPVTLRWSPCTPDTCWMIYIGFWLFWFRTCQFDTFTIELHVYDVLQLTIEKRKEIQQEKQKALDVQTRKQANRKKALLTRVQEILENVQVCQKISRLKWRHYKVNIGNSFSEKLTNCEVCLIVFWLSMICWRESICLSVLPSTWVREGP